MLYVGYPYNLDFEYGALAQLQHFSINNLGDPFIESNYGVHSRQFEVGVLDWFARLWDLEKNEYWGYITNCGTEGNLHGILVGSDNCHFILCCFYITVLSITIIDIAGEKYILMGFYMLPANLIIRSLKRLECIEWSVLRLIP